MPTSNKTHSIWRPITSYYHYVSYVQISKEILIWNKIPRLASGLLKTCHEIQVYLYFTCVGSSSQLGAFLPIKRSLFSSFSRWQGIHSAIHTGRKHRCKWPSHRVFISLKNRNTQWASHLSCQNIWLAQISQHQLHMSICTVTHTDEVSTCCCWTTAHIEKVVRQERNMSKLSFFRFNTKVLQNWVAL